MRCVSRDNGWARGWCGEVDKIEGRWCGPSSKRLSEGNSGHTSDARFPKCDRCMEILFMCSSCNNALNYRAFALPMQEIQAFLVQRLMFWTLGELMGKPLETGLPAASIASSHAG